MTSHLKVLVVEDDPVIRMMTLKQLAQLGVTGEAVGSGEEAISRSHMEVGLILMDIGLPGIDGIHATQLIREKELHDGLKHTPIVALTAHSDSRACLLSGMDDFLQKPALLADIKNMLERWMPNHEGS